MIAVKNKTCVPVIHQMSISTSSRRHSCLAYAVCQGVRLVLKKLFLANTHAPLLLPLLENGFAVSISLSILFHYTAPEGHLSILGFTLTIRQKKLSTAATELVPQWSCEIRIYVPSYKAQSGGICVCISKVTAGKLQAKMMTMCALQRRFLENVAVPTVKTCLTH